MNMSPTSIFSLLHLCQVGFSDKDRIHLTLQKENIIFVLMSIISVKHDFAFSLYH